jgi:beta-lactamase regulating signal transducer with metallopeptidase domain
MNSAEIFLLEMSCKSVVLMAAISLLMLCCRRAAAATRHFLWFAFLSGLLLLPLGRAVGLGWRAPGWVAPNTPPQWIKAGRARETAPAIKIAGQLKRVEPATRDARAGSPPVSVRAVAANRQIDWQRWLVFGWMAGVTFTSARLALRRATLRGIERASRVSDDSTAKRLLQTGRCELGLKRGVLLLESAQSLMPMTWGCWRPVVLLPSNVASWDEDRLRFVLRHELAHVQRWDCLTQGVGNLVCALYWFNPFAWHAQRQMRLERERACDDVVLRLDTRPSDYAGHLVAVASQFGSPQMAALPMARRSNLEGRVRAVLDFQRKRKRLNPLAAFGLATVAAVAALIVGGGKSAAQPLARSTFQNKLVRITPEVQRQAQINVLKSFALAKEKESMELAAHSGEKISPEFQRFFDAATNGDSQTVAAMYESFRNFQALDEDQRRTNALAMNRSSTPWFPVRDVGMAYDMVAKCEPKYTGIFTDGIIRSIPAGGIYFGGTDAGLAAPTALCKSHTVGDPFFTMTQNSLANNTYLEYVRDTYGKAIYIPTEDELQTCFSNYLADARRRFDESKLRPEEFVSVDNGNGRVQVSGRGAVMIINGGLTKLIFDKNPGQEFYIEEGWAMDWTYPYMEPHGLIMKLHRDAMAVLPNEALTRDREYWRPLINKMIGSWLQEETPLRTVTEFVQKIYVRKDFTGFMGDPLFVHNDYAAGEFSKLRGTIAGLYAWRVGALKDVPTPNGFQAQKGERERLVAEADFAFRQAFAMCPDSPELATRYAYFLVRQDRSPEALLLAETAQRVKVSMGGDDPKLEDLIDKLKEKTLIDPVIE